jgi:hypothetical protein
VGWVEAVAGEEDQPQAWPHPSFPQLVSLLFSCHRPSAVGQTQESWLKASVVGASISVGQGVAHMGQH